MAESLKKISTDLGEAKTIENVSSIFEIISTMKINQVRSGVVASNEFFLDLWNVYRQLLRSILAANITPRTWKHDKAVSLVVTSAGSFSGPADEEIITKVFSDEETSKGDFIVIGAKGVALLGSRGKKPVVAFDTPDIRRPIDVTNVSKLIREYKHAWGFYQSFESIGVQTMKRVNLLPASIALSDKDRLEGKAIDVQTYIFEPSFEEILNYLESVVLNITLTQIIFEAVLSEYANRFKVTSVVKDRARQRVKELTMEFNRTRRQTKDEALRQQLFQGSIL